MMKRNQRTHRYLGTFVNNAEGLSSYKLLIKNVRNTVTGGRFVKMFRAGTRSIIHPPLSMPFKSGCCKNDGTYFDVYLLSRYRYDGNVHSHPRFFNFVLD